MIRTPSRISAPAIATSGRRVTARPHRAHRPFDGSLARGRRKAGSLSEWMWSPTSESTAGSRVIAARTAVRTAIAEAKPSDATSGIPATASATRAMTTVPPAKTIAPPAVATARPIDSLISVPSASWVRWRLTMKRA